MYEAASRPDALDLGSWHPRDWRPRGLSHSRAGWAVHLAGAPGAELERRVGTRVAAAFIYLASDPALERVPDFFLTYKPAAIVADMRRLAEGEAA